MSPKARRLTLLEGTSRLAWASQVALVVKNLPANAGDTGNMSLILGWEYSLEEGVATHSSILAWRIPWAEEPGRSQDCKEWDTTEVT